MSEDAIEYFEERAAAYEFLGGMGRDKAERQARQDTARKYGPEVMQKIREVVGYENNKSNA